MEWVDKAGDLLGLLFGWAGLVWAVLLLVASVIWLFSLVRRWFMRGVLDARDAKLWRKHELGCDKIRDAAGDDDFDLAVLIVLCGFRKWVKAVPEGRVIEWESFEESQPCGHGRYLVQGGTTVFIATFREGGWWFDEKSVEWVVAWAKLPRVWGISNTEQGMPNNKGGAGGDFTTEGKEGMKR